MLKSLGLRNVSVAPDNMTGIVNLPAQATPFKLHAIRIDMQGGGAGGGMNRQMNLNIVFAGVATVVSLAGSVGGSTERQIISMSQIGAFQDQTQATFTPVLRNSMIPLPVDLLLDSRFAVVISWQEWDTGGGDHMEDVNFLLEDFQQIQD